MVVSRETSYTPSALSIADRLDIRDPPLFAGKEGDTPNGTAIFD